MTFWITERKADWRGNKGRILKLNSPICWSQLGVTRRKKGESTGGGEGSEFGPLVSLFSSPPSSFLFFHSLRSTSSIPPIFFSFMQLFSLPFIRSHLSFWDENWVTWSRCVSSTYKRVTISWGFFSPYISKTIQSIEDGFIVSVLNVVYQSLIKKKKTLPCDVLKAERAFIFSHMCTLIHTHAQSHTTTDKSAHTARAHSWWCHEINTMCCADENGAACLNAFPLHKVQFHNILSRGNSSHEGRSEALVQRLNKIELILL